MNNTLKTSLVLCDLDHLLLGTDGNLPQVLRDVMQLFSSRGGRLTVFSQRSPRAVRSILGSVRLAAPALVCGGTMAYHYADGNRVPLCSFAQQQELFACLPDTPGVGVAVQMQDGTTRVLPVAVAPVSTVDRVVEMVPDLMDKVEKYFDKKYKYRSAGACRCRKDHTVGGTVICHRADPCAGACGSSGCISGYGCAGAGAWNYDFFQAGATSAATDE